MTCVKRNVTNEHVYASSFIYLLMAMQTHTARNRDKNHVNIAYFQAVLFSFFLIERERHRMITALEVM